MRDGVPQEHGLRAGAATLDNRQHPVVEHRCIRRTVRGDQSETELTPVFKPLFGPPLDLERWLKGIIPPGIRWDRRTAQILLRT